MKKLKEEGEVGLIAAICAFVIIPSAIIISAYLPDTIVLAKHGYKMPPNYELVTNGKEYKWKSPNDSRFSFQLRQRYDYKFEAISDAWRDYGKEKRIEEYIKTEIWEKINEPTN